jgi:hypothetical protein
MSDPARKRSAKAAWDAMMGAFPADEAERIGALSEEEVDRELREKGVDPEEIAAMGGRAARGGGEKGKERAKENGALAGDGAIVAKAVPQAEGGEREAQRKPRKAEGRGEVFSFRARATVLLAAAAVILVFVYAYRREITAFFSPGPSEIGPDNEHYDMRSPEQKKAEEIRRVAFAACEREGWALCREQLDRARMLDPAGEEDAKVKGWRERLQKVPEEADGGKGKGP